MVSKLVESTSSSGTPASTSAASAETSVVIVMSLVVRLISFNLFILGVFSQLIFIDCSNNNSGSIFWLCNLDEGMVVGLSFLTSLTVVEVFANRALVSNA